MICNVLKNLLVRYFNIIVIIAIKIAIITMMMMITIATIDYLKGSIKKTTKLITLKFTYLDISRENELSWTYKYTFTIRFLNISTYGFNSVTFRRLPYLHIEVL